MVFMILLTLSFLVPILWVFQISVDYDNRPRKYLLMLLKLAPVPLILTLVGTGLAAPFTHDGYCREVDGGTQVCGLWDYIILQTEFTFVFTVVFTLVWVAFLALIAAVTLALHWVKLGREIRGMKQGSVSPR